MRAIAIGSLFVLLAAMPALGALPPQYQRQRELQAIIDSTAVVDAFEGATIDAVTWVGPDQYQVRGGACVLDITIKDLPTSESTAQPGPRQFEIVLGTPACSTIRP